MPVGLSNILDRELKRRKPTQRPHGKVVGAVVMDGKLLGEVLEGVKAVGRIETLLILPVATLHLAVVSWRVGTDEFMPDAQLGSGDLKQGGQIPSAVGETIGKLKAIVRLHALYPDTSAGVPLEQLLEEIRGRKGVLLRIGSQESQAGKLINSGILKQAQFWVSNALAGHHLHVHLNTLTWIGHLLVRLWFIHFFLRSSRKQPKFAHDSEQALRAAGIASQPQPVPQLHHAEVGIAAAHIPNQLQFCLRMLIWMAMGTSGLTGQGFHRAIPSSLPEVDVRPTLVVLPAGTAHTVFLCVFHQGLPVCHVLCYTLAHEGYGPLSSS